jgi:probable HAF family extracellular repeat protein
MKSCTLMWMTAACLFAAVAMPIQARVVYTPVNVTFPANGSYPIDLNHDGVNDFTFQTSNTIYLCHFYYYAYRNTLEVQQNPTGGIVGSNWASALQSGVQIDSHQSFYGSDDLMYDFQQNNGGPCRPPHMYGYWIAAQHQYLGLEFQINGQLHFGWAELSTNGMTGVNTLFGFAYETTPFKGIVTGQTTDTPDEPATTSPETLSGMAMQDNPSPDHRHRHHQYKLIDLGTFGGPNSYVPNFSLVSINSQGAVIVEADTTIPDPYYPNCFQPDCLVNHAGIWHHGVLTDLGVLPGVNTGAPTWINNGGVVTGVSEDGVIDPLTGGPEIHAVVWKHDQVIDLGTFGGASSVALAVNNRDTVTGFALNTILDPFEPSFGPPNFFCCGATQMHAFLWQGRALRDLGTLGGPDSAGEFVNERGQVAGVSYTSFDPNQNTGIPTQDPFLWDDGNMIDLGTLGGTAGWPWGLNNKGQVTGQSNLADDVHFHAFLWTRGRLKDLGTLGGDNSSARWINDAGEVVGRADLYPDLNTRHGFLWKNGAMTDLGVVGSDPCSTAYAINSSEQIVGVSSPCGQSGHGFLWENGGPMVDLQTLVLPGSDLTIGEVLYINDAGEISGFGTDSNGDQRGLLLIPCDEHHPGQCEDYSMIEAPASQTSASMAEFSTPTTQPSESPADTVNPLRNRFGRGVQLPGQLAAPRD